MHKTNGKKGMYLHMLYNTLYTYGMYKYLGRYMHTYSYKYTNIICILA